MRRGIVLDKYNNHVAVMTPNRDFLKIKKDPLVCTVGEEIWFSEKDIILPGLKKFFNKNSIKQLGFHTFAISFIIILFVFSGLITFIKTGDPKKLKGDFHSRTKQTISISTKSGYPVEKVCSSHSHMNGNEDTYNKGSELLQDVCNKAEETEPFYKKNKVIADDTSDAMMFGR